MPDFTVDIGGLAALNGNLSRGVENLDGALSSMRDVGPEPLGTPDLDDACQQFQESWEHGLGQIRECVEKVKGGLDETQRAYAELERALQQGFTQMSTDIAQ